ncbi:bZIP transcription factor [Ancylostoma caninum]|uniref:BZIP transcription factor n=2 Tax=Ancylostoma caninum TaxID=29170 RepID=A0A368F0P1_ANCCA|nr:bZIP transcription factor [Ancylostoma caninum]
MHAVLVRSPAKRHHDDVDVCSSSLKRTCRQEGNFPVFPCERERTDFSPFNNTVTVRNIDGVAKALELDDLVDMVLQVTKNIEDPDIAQHIVHLSKRRQQNKAAAARYRDKQKERKQNLQKEQAELEAKNAKLKAIISDLEREVADYKGKIMQMASDLNR